MYADLAFLGAAAQAELARLYWSVEELPVGIHLVATYEREALLAHLASQLEQARPWTVQRLRVHA